MSSTGTSGSECWEDSPDGACRTAPLRGTRGWGHEPLSLTPQVERSFSTALRKLCRGVVGGDSAGEALLDRRFLR